MKIKVKLKADLKPEVLEKLRTILRKHKVEWEEEIIVKDESKKECRKKFVTNRKGSYEI
jgi:ATP-dependent RNA circularization protein (DNA/RNA ligase family)